MCFGELLKCIQPYLNFGLASVATQYTRYTYSRHILHNLSLEQYVCVLIYSVVAYVTAPILL